MDWLLLSFSRPPSAHRTDEHWEKGWNFKKCDLPFCLFRDYLLNLFSYCRSLRPNHSGVHEAFIMAKELDELSSTYIEIFVVHLHFFQGISFKSPSAFICLLVSQVLKFSQFFRPKQSNQHAHYNFV